MRISLLLIFFVLTHNGLIAQEQKETQFAKAIEDNSYFIEEAYNQEDGVVQHVSNGYYKMSPTKDFMYSFTQEWPVGSQKHQFSYTIGYSWLNSNSANGIPDFLINYRYQLTGHDDFITLAPRFSVILPTGNENKGLGNGVLGYQFNLPMSKRLTNAFACHANVGLTLLPGVKTVDLSNNENKNNLLNINMGASVIWLATQKLNLMFEILHNIYRIPNPSNKMVTVHETIVSPGFRYAIDVKQLQIVPGIAIPTTIRDGKSDTGIFFYLSFEHPF